MLGDGTFAGVASKEEEFVAAFLFAFALRLYAGAKKRTCLINALQEVGIADLVDRRVGKVHWRTLQRCAKKQMRSCAAACSARASRLATALVLQIDVLDVDADGAQRRKHEVGHGGVLVVRTVLEGFDGVEGCVD